MSTPATVDLPKPVPQSFFVRDNGDTVLQERGILTDREISRFKIHQQNYQEMYLNVCLQ